MLRNKEKRCLTFFYSCSVHLNKIKFQVPCTLHFKGAKRSIRILKKEFRKLNVKDRKSTHGWFKISLMFWTAVDCLF